MHIFLGDGQVSTWGSGKAVPLYFVCRVRLIFQDWSAPPLLLFSMAGQCPTSIILYDFSTPHLYYFV